MPPDPFAALGQAFSELVLLPFKTIGWLFRMRQRWRAVGLDVKSHIRIRTSTFFLVALIGASAFRLIPYDNRIEIYGALAVGGYALLNLGIGAIGLRFARSLRFDPMSLVWWCAGAAGCAVLAIHAGVLGW
jgi:hypothetical protein